MRGIKFRAWDKRNQEMTDFSSMPFYITDIEVSWDKFDFMQFTGLKDKNGKEIYEGDVVRHLNIYTNHEKWEIKYSRAQFILLAGSTYLPLSHVDLGTVKVIGSKFENPELLDQHHD